MAALEDARAERYAQALAESEPAWVAFQRAYGTGDYALYHQVRDRQDIADRVTELQG